MTWTWGTTSNLQLTYWDKGSGMRVMDGAFYRPHPQTPVTLPNNITYNQYTIGDYCQGNYNPVSGTVTTILVSTDDTSNVVAYPTGYQRIWYDKGSGADMDGAIWLPIAPPGYVAMGYVSTGANDDSAYNPPSNTVVICVSTACVQACPLSNLTLIWSDEHSHADEDVSVYAIGSTGLFYAQADYNKPSGQVWMPATS